MTPKELILNGIYAACDNGHDMGIKDEVLEDNHINLNQYAVSCIVEDICEGEGQDFPECAYLEQYDDDDVLIKHSIASLRAVLVEALVEFYTDEALAKKASLSTEEAKCQI